MTHNFTTGHPRSWYVVMWKDSEPEVWPHEFCEGGILRKGSLCALLSTLNLTTGIFCHLQQQLSYWYLYWILNKLEQLLHQLIIWQVLIIIVPHKYNTNRTKLLIITVIFTLLYFISLFYYSFFICYFVPSFCIIIFWFDAFSLCSSKNIIQNQTQKLVWYNSKWYNSLKWTNVYVLLLAFACTACITPNNISE